MPTDPYQTFTRDWQRRASQLSAAGVAPESYKMLQQRDAYNVIVNGGTPMTDAEVYAGVQSAVHGPQIKDPQLQHGGHGWWSDITDVVGNVGQDVKGIITGWPAGIAHTVAHLPSEFTNAGELIAHLATGDNKWLHQKGYLAQGDNLHESWSDFGTILRAMDANGSKQLLPMLPFISDLANMTSRQGRNILMQHPVGTVLDAWPGVAGLGRLATAGKDFSMAAMADKMGLPVETVQAMRDGQLAAAKRAADEVTKNKGARAGERAGVTAFQRARTEYDPNLFKGMKEPRLWAAGRALQRGSPLRAVISAAGDIVPVPVKDGEIGRVTTLRQRTNTIASAMGLTSSLREGVVRGWEAGKQEADLQLKKQYFSDPILNGEKADRVMDLWKIAHFVNPVDDSPLSMDEYNQLRNSLSEEERGAMTAAGDFNAMLEREALAHGMAGQVPLAHGLETVSKKSDLWKAYQNLLDVQKKMGEDTGSAVDTAKLHSDLQAAQEKFAQAQVDYLPPGARAGFIAHIKAGVKASVSQLLTGKALEDALNTIKHSPYSADLVRLLGSQAKFDAMVKDAMVWWWDMSEKGAAPLWMHNVSDDEIRRSLIPKMQIAKEKFPSILKSKATVKEATTGDFYDFVNGHGTVMNLAAVLNRTQAEMVYARMHNDFVKTFVLPRAMTVATRTREYQAALDEARKHLSPEAARKLPSVQQVIAKNFIEFNPEKLGLDRQAFPQTQEKMLIDDDTYKVLKKLVAPPPEWMRNRILRRGTSLYKFAVLTGPRHLAHVGVGGFMMMLGGEPLAPRMLFRSWKLMSGRANPEDYGLAGQSLSGMKEDYYQMGPRHTYQDYRISPERGWWHQVGGIMGEHYLTDLIHQAKQKGVPILEYIPNQLSKLETNLMTMYKASVYLSRRARGLDEKAALEGAHKLFVDMNGMSTMERTVVRTVFPFYAFTRHLFRYLGTYPVDYPLRAAIITNFAEQEQADWNTGLPRSYQSLFSLGSFNSQGDITAFDLKNANPFRSFANDFSIAGFTSSLSPFITMPLDIMGFDTLSGTTQLYPGTSYDPYTGTIKADPQPGWQYSVADAFVPQFGLLDHYLKLTDATKFIAATDPAAYRKQLYNMLNMPFMPEVINVPYAKEITEMRRFRQAQSAVATVQKNPSPQNISKLLEFNAVPFDNNLVAPQALANYYTKVREVLAGVTYAGQEVSPKTFIPKPRTKKAQVASF